MARRELKVKSVTEETRPLLVETSPLLRAFNPDLPAFSWVDQPAWVIRFEDHEPIEADETVTFTTHWTIS